MKIFISTRSAQDERFIKWLNEKGDGVSKSKVIRKKSKGKGMSEDIEVIMRFLDRKLSIIVWKSEYLGTKPQFELLSIFDREDLNAVFQLTTKMSFGAPYMIGRFFSWKLQPVPRGTHFDGLMKDDEELSIPEQTATGKGTSNPLMAGSLPKTTKPT
ncbi:hypothetical protein Tco_0972216 [Tanacetum coccineum]